MPLITDNIFQARAAYSDLELRVQSSQLNVATLQATVDHLNIVHQNLVDNAVAQGQYTSQTIATNANLTTQQATAVSPDITLDNFIASLGLSIALAEATMPDRAIHSVSASVQSFLTFNTGADGVTKLPGLRLYQPELGASTALATTSFDIAKVGAAVGAPAPRSLYTVWLEKQALFANSFWAKFVSGTPPQPPAEQIVAEIVKVFASVGAWSFPYLLQEATTIAALETTLTTPVAAASSAAGAVGAAAAYSSSVAALSTLTAALNARNTYVAGDLYALAAALDATTNFAALLLP